MALTPSGSLLTLDPALREFLLRADEDLPEGEKFIIKKNLGEGHLLVSLESVEFLKELVQNWQNSNSFDDLEEKKKEEVKAKPKRRGR